MISAPSVTNISNVATVDPTGCTTNDGSITVSATGTSLEYSINGGLTWQPNGNFTNLAGGTYFVFVRNQNDACEVYGQSVVLTDKVAPSISQVTKANPSDLLDGPDSVEENVSDDEEKILKSFERHCHK